MLHFVGPCARCKRLASIFKYLLYKPFLGTDYLKSRSFWKPSPRSWYRWRKRLPIKVIARWNTEESSCYLLLMRTLYFSWEVCMGATDRIVPLFSRVHYRYCVRPSLKIITRGLVAIPRSIKATDPQQHNIERCLTNALFAFEPNWRHLLVDLS